MESKERVSKDGKMIYTIKKEVNGVEMDFSFLDNIIDNYDKSLDNESQELFDFETKHGVE